MIEKLLNICCIVVISVMFSGFALAQEITIDWKYHNVGRVKQLITNKGPLWGAGYPVVGSHNCNYPPGSNEEHIGEAGIWVGGITPENDTLVSVTTGWNPHITQHPRTPFEFWPMTNESWDTIWVVNRNDTVDIPYWEKFVGLSDQDFVCRYNDYNDVSLTLGTHKPLYVDVIQVSHAWSSPKPLNEIILYDFYVIPKQFDLKDVYISYWADPNVGESLSDIQQFLRDDRSLFVEKHKMGIGMDAPGDADGDAVSPIGFKVMVPEKIAKPEDLKWTFKWGESRNPPGITPTSDGDKYRQLMASNTIMGNQNIPSGSHFIVSFGPVNLKVNDTLYFRVAEILGEGLEGVTKTADLVDLLNERNFQLPAPPPSPPLRVETDNHKVKLIWNPTDDVNPEIYSDKNRADGETQPFEGYRLYKSNTSENGPWKLLAEYDIAGNGIASENGLRRDYTDMGLVNNVQYFYTITAFSKEDKILDWPSLESSVIANAKTIVPGTPAPDKVGQVAVVPNPYRGDIDYNSYSPPWEPTPSSRSFWMEQDRRIQFINLPNECDINIFTVAGDLVQTLEHRELGNSKGYHDWNLTSSVGQAVASGIYLFAVKDVKTGEVQTGKFVIIK